MKVKLRNVAVRIKSGLNHKTKQTWMLLLSQQMLLQGVAKFIKQHLGSTQKLEIKLQLEMTASSLEIDPYACAIRI